MAESTPLEAAAKALMRASQASAILNWEDLHETAQQRWLDRAAVTIAAYEQARRNHTLDSAPPPCLTCGGPGQEGDGGICDQCRGQQ